MAAVTPGFGGGQKRQKMHGLHAAVTQAQHTHTKCGKAIAAATTRKQLTAQ